MKAAHPWPLLVRAGLVRMDQQGLLRSRTAASQPPSIDPAWQACFTWRPRQGAETFMHHLGTARAASSPIIALEQQLASSLPSRCRKKSQAGLYLYASICIYTIPVRCLLDHNRNVRFYAVRYIGGHVYIMARRQRTVLLVSRREMTLHLL
jgi:hypothetical protein